MELWDAYDQYGNLLPRTLVRGQALPRGCYHVVAEIAVRHADGSLLLTLRDPDKPSYPNYWEMGAGGSVLRGETWEAGAKRELFEETGLRAERLQYLFRAVLPASHAIYAGYCYHYNGPKDAIVLQPGETVDYRWLSPAELADFCRSDRFVTAQRKRWRAFIDSAATF